jgi:flagellar biosynthetic protein FliO
LILTEQNFSGTKKMKAKSFLFIWIFFISVVQAQDSTTRETGDFDIKKVREAVFSATDTTLNEDIHLRKSAENYSLVILRVVFYLAVVIAVIFAVAWIVKKSGLTGSSRIGGGGAMDVLEILPFGQNRTITMIRVMDAVYLLGQTPQSIVLLEKIEGQKAIDLIASSKGGSSIVQFKDAFNSFISKMKKQG